MNGWEEKFGFLQGCANLPSLLQIHCNLIKGKRLIRHNETANGSTRVQLYNLVFWIRTYLSLIVYTTSW